MTGILNTRIIHKTQVHLQQSK